MKQFKELTIDGQLDLIKHLLEGGKLDVYEGTWHLDDNQCESYIHINYADCYRKTSDELQMIYHEADIIQAKIDAELKRLGKPVTKDNIEVVQSPSEDKKTSENDSLERITYENWKSLGIKVCDKVEAVGGKGILEDEYFDDVIVTDLETPCYEGYDFIELDEWWVDIKLDCDELYLVRTEEGSLND